MALIDFYPFGNPRPYGQGYGADIVFHRVVNVLIAPSVRAGIALHRKDFYA